jgi:hypothetical protein
MSSHESSSVVNSVNESHVWAKTAGYHESGESKGNDESSVWILTRPLDLPIYLSSLSRRKSALSHWGVLFSPLRKEELEEVWEEVQKKTVLERRRLDGTAWGTLFELIPQEGKTTMNSLDFGAFGPLSLANV